MRTMSTRWQPTPRWGWLLLLGGLTACGYNMPWGSPQATGGPAGSGRSGDITEDDDSETIDPNRDPTKDAGVFTERFVKANYGAAWSMRTADLDGNGTNELLYGGQGVVAFGEDGRTLWTFDIPAVGREPDLEGGHTAKKLRFMGLHVRALHIAQDTLLVLDSVNRIHRLDAATGEHLYTVNLQGDGTACDFVLIDADGDKIPDFFPSGGTSAYSGATGEKLWDAEIDFTPSMVRSGNLNAESGRELLLIGNASPEDAGDPYGICPSEKNALMAMHEGLDERLDEGLDEARPGEESERPDKVVKSGIVAVDARGKTLYVGNVPEGKIYAASIYDLDGDDRGEAIVGLRDSVVTLDTEGQVVRELRVDGQVKDILAEDLDGDAQSELIVHAYGNDESTVYGFGKDGEELWNARLGAHAYVVEAIDLDDDGAKELITGLGYRVDQEPTTPVYEDEPANVPPLAPTVAWKLAADGPQELWRVETPVPARAVAATEGNVIEIATGDAQLYRVAVDTGETIGTWTAGSMNHAMGAGDIDGDGIAEVVTGDVFGNVVVLGADGNPIFEGKLEGVGPAVVTGIDVAHTEEGDRGMFVVSGFAWRGENAGVLQAFDDQGNTLFSVTTAKGLAEAKFADLDGDGSLEIVVPYFGFRIGQGSRQGEAQQDREGRSYEEPMGDQACGVMAYDLDGNLLWQRDVALCDIAQLAVGDSDGDGIDEVAYGDLGRSAPYHVALLEGDGTIRWDIASDIDDAVWLEVVDDGVAFGGRSEQEDGHVTLLAAEDGKEKWRIDMGGKLDPNAPKMEDSPFGVFAGSLFGQKLEDLNGDRVADIAFTTVEGEIRVVDGANGEVLWEDSFKDVTSKVGKDQDAEAYQDRAANFVGGPLTYVPGSEGAPGLLVVTAYDFRNLGSEAFAFRVDTGEILGSVPLDELVVGVSPAMWGGEQRGISITTTYDTYGMNINEEPPRQGDRPRPTRDSEFDDLRLD